MQRMALKLEMVKCLLEGGANPKLKDAAGNTPLSLVARSAIVDRAGTTKAQLNSVWKLLQPVSDPLNPNIRRKICESCCVIQLPIKLKPMKN